MNIKEAELQIAQILKSLESSGDFLVDNVELIDIDVTGMNDDRQQIHRRVVINTHRLPGHKWST